MKKRLVSMFLVVAMCMGLSVPAFAAETKNTIEFTVAKNDVFGESIGLREVNTFGTNGSDELSMEISGQDNNFMTATLNWDGQEIFMTGTMEDVPSASGVNKLGTFKGYTGDVLITADVNYAYDGNAFVGLTIGVAAEETVPQIVFFGNYSDSIREAYTAVYERDMEVNQNDAPEDVPFGKVARINGATVYQEEKAILSGNYNLGVVSLFHADELRNQGNMRTYAKINSNSDGVKKYLRNVKGYGNDKVIGVMITDISLSILSQDNNLFIENNGCLPENGVTKFETDIPYVIAGSFGTFPISITTSKTTVTLTKNSGSSSNNNVKWVLNKSGGWSALEMDGGSSSKNTGMVGCADYTYQGNVSTNRTATMKASGNITYKCYISDPDDGGTTVRLSLPTATATTSASGITIYP